MARTFAAGTSVPVEKTRADLEKLLAAHGIIDTAVFNSGTAGQAVVLFSFGKTPVDRRQVRIGLSVPRIEDFAKQMVRGWKQTVSAEKQRKAWEQACREKWRLLYLVVKAKLEAVAGGISTTEKEFLAFLALPRPVESRDGGDKAYTIGDALAPQIADMAATGAMPPLLLGIGSGS